MTRSSSRNLAVNTHLRYEEAPYGGRKQGGISPVARRIAFGVAVRSRRTAAADQPDITGCDQLWIAIGTLASWTRLTMRADYQSRCRVPRMNPVV